jgi:hypothetical protein
MTLKKTLKIIFSLPTLKKITLYLLLFSVGSVSIIFLTLHQPWRYLKIAHPSDIILPKNPSKSPWIFVIEAPKLNLKITNKSWIPISHRFMSIYLRIFRKS